MAVRKSKPVAEEPVPEPPPAVDPIVVPSVGSELASGDLAEYQTEDGATYLLTAEDAKARGAKAVAKPANRAQTPSNK